MRTPPDGVNRERMRDVDEEAERGGQSEEVNEKINTLKSNQLLTAFGFEILNGEK